ncbi:MAG: acetoacetyl-CoA reductase [Alphaproteobacteria bacterium]|nr:acetoacetyl-CoA reductase [Alphaproteobacteria bacterium]
MARVALVTGGTRGIGATISTALQAAGYRVAANYGGSEEPARKFHSQTGIQTYKFSVADYAATGEGIARIGKELGPIDVVVNNAGITRDGFLHRMKPEQWSEVIATNLSSCFNVSRHVIEGMRERGFGRIVNISSINGQKGQFGQTNYSAAKAGMLGFTRALALENASRGITVNAIAPGYIKTEMVAAMPAEQLAKVVATIPVGRLGEASDVARCVVFLAADEAGFITGATFTVNGAQYIAA